MHASAYKDRILSIAATQLGDLGLVVFSKDVPCIKHDCIELQMIFVDLHIIQNQCISAAYAY